MCPRICAFLYTCKQELVILGWMKTDALEGVRVGEEDVYLVVARKPWRRRARYLASLSTPVCSATFPGPPTLPTLFQCNVTICCRGKYALICLKSKANEQCQTIPCASYSVRKWRKSCGNNTKKSCVNNTEKSCGNNTKRDPPHPPDRRPEYSDDTRDKADGYFQPQTFSKWRTRVKRRRNDSILKAFFTSIKIK